jgi:hypothetical protein
MSWFNYLSRDGSFDDANARYIFPPMRNQIKVSAPYYDIEPNNLLVVKINDDSFYTKVDKNKTKTTDNKQYVVVYQSDPTSNIFKVVKSNIINLRIRRILICRSSTWPSLFKYIIIDWSCIYFIKTFLCHI